MNLDEFDNQVMGMGEHRTPKTNSPAAELRAAAALLRGPDGQAWPEVAAPLSTLLAEFAAVVRYETEMESGRYCLSVQQRYALGVARAVTKAATP